MARPELSPEQRQILNTIPYFRDRETAHAIAENLRKTYKPENELYITSVEVDCIEPSDKTSEDTIIRINYEDATRMKNTGPEDSGFTWVTFPISWRNPNNALPEDKEKLPEPVPHTVGVNRAVLLSEALKVLLFIKKRGFSFHFENGELQSVRKT